MEHKGKLELTWVGKYDDKVIEPRILVEDREKSYGDPHSENMLIHGDNLIALQALQQDFAGKIKCIYIDPPFNTGQAFENYDDNLEMSIWLSLMRKRIQLLHELLSDDGTMFVHIDDGYLPYITILLDEVFGRHNRLYLITFKQGAATGVIRRSILDASQPQIILLWLRRIKLYGNQIEFIQKKQPVIHGTPNSSRISKILFLSGISLR